MEPITIGLALYAFLSNLGNIWQGIEHAKLQKRIEILNVIIRSLEKQIEELRTELEAQRWWNMRTKATLKRDINKLYALFFDLTQTVRKRDEKEVDQVVEQMRRMPNAA